MRRVEQQSFIVCVRWGQKRAFRVTFIFLCLCAGNPVLVQRSPAIGDSSVKAGRIYTQRALSLFFFYYYYFSYFFRLCARPIPPPPFSRQSLLPSVLQKEGGWGLCERAYRQRVIRASGRVFFSFLEEAPNRFWKLGPSCFCRDNGTGGRKRAVAAEREEKLRNQSGGGEDNDWFPPPFSPRNWLPRGVFVNRNVSGSVLSFSAFPYLV